jgi:hypothetical protein
VGGYSSPSPYGRKAARPADNYRLLLLSQACGLFVQVSGQVHHTHCEVASSNCAANRSGQSKKLVLQLMTLAWQWEQQRVEGKTPRKLKRRGDENHSICHMLGLREKGLFNTSFCNDRLLIDSPV